MGIKGLWNVLAPFSEKKSLHEISGETIAVDLSGWVCDSQNVTDYYIQPRLYLRNLFFRTLYLLLAGVKPIFVLEGDAPELKRDVMATRNAIQFRGAAPKLDKAPKKKPDVTRRRFRGVLKECETMLKCMGVSCIKGHGEAEATCALLNSRGLADAVVSQDSDCFAYGAHRVYRNFSVSSSAGGGALLGSVDCYDATHIFQQNGFGRNKMVALALLCGCDYGVGACGSSIVTAVAFLHTVADADIIPRLLSWVSEPQKYEEQQRWVSTPGRCNRCGHGGRTHGKNGCPTCATNRACHDTGHKSKMADVKRELSLRSRALSCGAPFPEPKIMKEFLQKTSEEIDLEQLNTSTPSMIQFVKLMRSKLEWNERYCVEKFLPVLTRWHLQSCVPFRTIEPVAIKKKRNPRGVPSYEVVWSDVNGEYEGLIPDEQYEGEDPINIWTTVERQDLMKTYYPVLVDAYEESIKKPPKEKKTRGRKNKDPQEAEKPKRKYTKKNVKKNNNDIEIINESLSTLNLTSNKESKANVSVKVNKLKRKIKTNRDKVKNQKTIDSFLSKRRKSMRNLIQSLRNSFKDITLNSNEDHGDELTVKENINIDKESFNIDFSEDDAHDNIDLSDIVDKIISTAPISKTATVNNNLVKLVFTRKYSPRKSAFRKSVLNQIQNNCSTPKNSSIRKIKTINANVSADLNTSYFFDKLTDECDAFELSVDCKDYADCDKTVDYSINDCYL